MKPRTKLQRRIVAASGRLPEITPAQLHWGYAHLLPHEAFRTKRGKITCTECRHTWQGDRKSTVPSARIAGVATYGRNHPSAHVLE